MKKIVIPLIFLFILLMMIHIVLLHYGTQIGKEGHRNIILINAFFIAESLLIFAIGLLWGINPEVNRRLYAIAFIVFGVILLIIGTAGMRNILRETPNDLVTEELSDVRIVYAGYHNQDRKLEGTVNGAYSWFMLRGGDKTLAQQIEDSGKTHVTVVYHSSNRRIESIFL